VAELRSVFGDGIKLVCVSENGHEAGSAADLEHMRDLLTHARTHACAREPDTHACVCDCKACKPTAAMLKARQKRAGEPFGLNGRKRFRVPSTYRAEFADERWERWLERVRAEQEDKE
jgi:hypothetical protein